MGYVIYDGWVWCISIGPWGQIERRRVEPWKPTIKTQALYVMSRYEVRKNTTSRGYAYARRVAYHECFFKNAKAESRHRENLRKIR